MSSSPFRSLTLLQSAATSVGDVMRDLDSRDLITGNFLLVSGDVVANLAIEPVLAKHRARREKDKNAIMTMILREAGSNHRTKSRGRRPVFIIDPSADRCLHYEEMSHRQRKNRYVNIDPELLSSHTEIEVREDLIDCYIDICTPEVLSLWSDNFDYQSMRKSFLFGVLKDYELNGKTIHTHILQEHYAARVRSLRAYDAISRDIISRWTYPLCPDSNLVIDQAYRLGRGKVYEEDGVILARSSVLKKRTVIGKGTSIGDGSVVGDSVVGRRCQVGKNVTIEDSYIWDHTVIGDGSVIRQAVLANEVVIGRDCVIEPGALVSFGVRISDKRTVSGVSRITSAKQTGQNTISETDLDVVGKGGEGYSYTSGSDDDSDGSSTTSLRLTYLNPAASFSNSSISTIHSDESASQILRDSSRRDSFRSDHSDDTFQTRDFHVEATASILDGLQKGDSPDVIHLELLSQRLTANADDHMLRSALVSAFMTRISNLTDPSPSSDSNDQALASGLGAGEAVKLVFRKYRFLVEQLAIFDKASEEKADQVDFLILVQRDVVGRHRGENLLLFVAKELYDLEVVEEEGVLQWWDDARSAEGDMGRVRGLTGSFVDWLREAEEGDSEDEEESEEEE